MYTSSLVWLCTAVYLSNILFDLDTNFSKFVPPGGGGRREAQVKSKRTISVAVLFGKDYMPVAVAKLTVCSATCHHHFIKFVLCLELLHVCVSFDSIIHLFGFISKFVRSQFPTTVA